MAAQPLAAVVMSSPTRNASRLLTYVLREKAGQAAGTRYVAASGLNGAIPEVAMQQYRDNRKRWGKDGQRQVIVTGKDGVVRTLTEGQFVQGYHVIQSFAREGEGALDPAKPEDRETAHRLGRQLGARLAGRGRHAVVVTQIDGTTGCLHNHLVIDSVDRVTGRSFDSSIVKHKSLAATHDTLLAEAGYVQQNQLASTAAERREPSEERGRLAHEQWVAGGEVGREPFSVAVLKQRIHAAMKDPRAVSFEAYTEVLRESGVIVDVRGGQNRGLTYGMALQGEDGEPTGPTRATRRRASKLGTNYMRGAVDAAVERHAEQARQAVAQPPRRPTFEDLAAVASGTAHDRAAALASSMTLPPAATLGPRLQLPTEPPAAPRRVAPSRAARPAPPDPHAAARQARIAAMEVATQQRLAAAEAERAALVRQMAEENDREAPDEPTTAQTPALVPLPPEPAAPLAPLPAPAEDEVYRSAVRDVQVERARDAEFRDRVADLDEHVVGVGTAAGRVYDAALLEGMTVAKVARYADVLAPETLEVLGWRDAMSRRARQAFMAGETYESQRLRERVRQGLIYDPGAATAHRQEQDAPAPNSRDDPQPGE